MNAAHTRSSCSHRPCDLQPVPADRPRTRHRARLPVRPLLPLALALWACTRSSAAQTGTELVDNGGFEKGLAGWQDRPIAGHTPTNSSADATHKHSGQQSLCVVGNGEKAGVHQTCETLPPCRLLKVSYWGRIEPSPELSGTMLAIGVDLGVRLDDGRTDWFLPDSLRLGQREVGGWVRKASWYRIPNGRKIQSLTVHCINYGNSGSAWFDDVSVVPVSASDTAYGVCIVQAMTEHGQENLRDIQRRLKEAGMDSCLVAPLTPLDGCKILILPEVPDDAPFYRWVRNYYYADGGRIIAVGLGDNRYADGLRRFVWTTPRTDSVQTTADGRGVYIAASSDCPRDFGALIRQTMEAGETLPAQLAARTFSKRRTTELRDACLLVDGRPFLLRAMGAYYVRSAEEYQTDLAGYSRMGLNAVVAYIDPTMAEEEFLRFLDEAEKNALLIIVWFRVSRPVRESGGIPWRTEWLLRFLRYRQHPALLSWLMSDDTADGHYPVIRRIHALLRRYDASNLLTATCFAYRYPERLTPEQWQRWLGLMDYPTTYDYPLNKDDLDWKANLCVGLEDIQLLAHNVGKVHGRETYFHLWAQSHLQGHVTKSLGLAGNEQFLTSAEQTRLLTFMMLSAGARGILYFHARAFSDDFLGVGRRGELALVWQELAPFEELIASGTRRPAVEVSDPEVEAVTFSKGDRTLLMLIKHGDAYHRFVANGGIAGVSVTLDVKTLPGAKAWCVDYPQVTPVSTEVNAEGLMKVHVDAADLTSLILITAGSGGSEELLAQRRATLSRAVSNALDVCRDKQAKTEAVLEAIADEGGVMPREVGDLLQRGADLTQAGVMALDRQELSTSFAALRNAVETYREVQKLAVAQAEEEWRKQGADEGAYKYLNMFFTLPSFYSMLQTGQPLVAGKLGSAIRSRLAE